MAVGVCAAVRAAPRAEVAGAFAARERAAPLEVEVRCAAPRAPHGQDLILHVLPRRKDLALGLIELLQAQQLRLKPPLRLLLHLLAHQALQQAHPPLDEALEDLCRDTLPQLRIAEGRGGASEPPSAVGAEHAPFPLAEQSELLPRTALHVAVEARTAREMPLRAECAVRVPHQASAERPDAAHGGLFPAEIEQRLEERVRCSHVCARAVLGSIGGEHAHKVCDLGRRGHTAPLRAGIAQLLHSLAESEHVRGRGAPGLQQLGRLEAGSVA
eukprot:CAMPEP_0180202408 /NCGR_PEP_ID=MMETSP0987-20121128/7289_1 /TAXON_ID=697907 /ORGANISM="non described non described, Strain CCMP2293" /LENGTH=270 /DNA_ID=CAMNT_0022157683 /DNA_START=626 /DNA_END=1435 /DNA_ORIENTATION=+